MNIKSKIKILQAACVLILGILSFIQFSLIKNTYQLTRNNYYKEVNAAMNKIINPPSVALENKVLNDLININYPGTSSQINEQSFLKVITAKTDSVIKAANKSLNHLVSISTVLKGVRYYSNYEKITVEVNGKKRILFTALGKAKTNTNNNLLLIRNYTVSYNGKMTTVNDRNNPLSDLKIWVKGSQYADISGWEQEVFKRMAGTFMLAISLLIAVALLFYLIFSTMLRQKRLADIKTDLTNNITHELKTPLSSVGLIIKSLERKDIQANQPRFNELLQSLSRQQLKIQHTIDSVMESAMFSSLAIELTESDITAYLTRYTRDLMLIYPSFTTGIAPDLQLLKTHIPTLEKALNNLIENAAKYSPKDSAILLKAYRNGAYYLIEVIDNGPGIAKQYQDQIFNKFYRIPENNRHTVKGLGLGLYISKEAVNQIAGTLTLISKPGKGCNFTIKLPVELHNRYRQRQLENKSSNKQT